MLMPGRSYSSTAYKYGFNGKEKDDEFKGAGNSLDFGARIHDPRLGRFLSLDPLSKKFPSESNYSFAGNNPIYLVDNNGEEKTTYYKIIAKDGTVMFKKFTQYGVKWSLDFKGIHAYNYSQTVVIDKRIGTTTVFAPVIDYTKDLGIKQGLYETAISTDAKVVGSADNEPYKMPAVSSGVRENGTVLVKGVPMRITQTSELYSTTENSIGTNNVTKLAPTVTSQGVPSNMGGSARIYFKIYWSEETKPNPTDGYKFENAKASIEVNKQYGFFVFSQGVTENSTTIGVQYPPRIEAAVTISAPGVQIKNTSKQSTIGGL
jgi:RHS repeat-associated protein